MSPAVGSTHSTTVDFQWLPNNNADHTTGDYSFLLQIASDPGFVNIRDSYTVKVWNKYTTPIYTLKSGPVYWRVVATYTQNPIGEKTVKYSETWSFNYDGNDGSIYVDPATLTTGNLGSKLQPVKTIIEAFNVSIIRKLSRINLANNSYSESLPLYNGYVVKGCYSPITWNRDTGACATSISDGTGLLYYQINN